jgi:hypothetical protein
LVSNFASPCLDAKIDLNYGILLLGYWVYVDGFIKLAILVATLFFVVI